MLMQPPPATAPPGGGRHRHHHRRRDRADSSPRTEGEGPIIAAAALRKSARFTGEQLGRFISDMHGVQIMNMNQLKNVVAQILPSIETGIFNGYQQP